MHLRTAASLYPLESLAEQLCAPGGWLLCTASPGLPQGYIRIDLGWCGHPLRGPRSQKDRRRGKSGLFLFGCFSSSPTSGSGAVLLWLEFLPGSSSSLAPALRVLMTPFPLSASSVLGVGTTSWLPCIFFTLSTPLKGFPPFRSLHLNHSQLCVSNVILIDTSKSQWLNMVKVHSSHIWHKSDSPLSSWSFAIWTMWTLTLSRRRVN